MPVSNDLRVPVLCRDWRSQRQGVVAVLVHADHLLGNGQARPATILFQGDAPFTNLLEQA